MHKMKGISPKIWPPLQLALGGVVADWASDGNISRGAIAAVLVATIAVGFAYLAPIGEVEPSPAPTLVTTNVVGQAKSRADIERMAGTLMRHETLADSGDTSRRTSKPRARAKQAAAASDASPTGA